MEAPDRDHLGLASMHRTGGDHAVLAVRTPDPGIAADDSTPTKDCLMMGSWQLAGCTPVRSVVVVARQAAQPLLAVLAPVE